ncbi:MAG: site-specific integrase, partial [Clostridia bacterium]|nr:site-specific integrase [Clostridia bacterium]
RTIKVDPSKTENAQRREVEKEAAALETDYRRHLITDGKKITIEELAQEFMSTHGKRLAHATAYHYEHMLKGRILPEFGKTYVQDLSPRDIRRFYQKLEKTPALTARSKTGNLSGNTILHYHRCLHAMLTYAVRSGYIAINPADAVEPPRNDRQETAFYELEDCGKLLEALDALPDTQWRLFFYMSIYTGCRPGELIGLNWSDISGNVLTVRAGAVYVNGKGTIRTDRPKTQKSIRMIDLPPAVMKILQQHKREQAEYRLGFGGNWPEPDAVFTGATGCRLNISSPTQKFQKIVKAYNLRPITLYGLRHTAATIMIAQGLNARDVAARLGHSQTSTTLNIYAHAFMDANTRATNAIAEALENARKEAK